MLLKCSGVTSNYDSSSFRKVLRDVKLAWCRLVTFLQKWRYAGLNFQDISYLARVADTRCTPGRAHAACAEGTGRRPIVCSTPPINMVVCSFYCKEINTHCTCRPDQRFSRELPYLLGQGRVWPFGGIHDIFLCLMCSLSPIIDGSKYGHLRRGGLQCLPTGVFSVKEMCARLRPFSLKPSSHMGGADGRWCRYRREDSVTWGP